jgi:hypothetical protein
MDANDSEEIVNFAEVAAGIGDKASAPTSPTDTE